MTTSGGLNGQINVNVNLKNAGLIPASQIVPAIGGQPSRMSFPTVLPGFYSIPQGPPPPPPWSAGAMPGRLGNLMGGVNPYLSPIETKQLEELQQERSWRNQTLELQRLTKMEASGWKDEQKESNKLFRNMLGAAGFATLIRQSKIFETFAGATLELTGALVDQILLPLVPVLVPALQALGAAIALIAPGQTAAMKAIQKVIDDPKKNLIPFLSGGVGGPEMVSAMTTEKTTREIGKIRESLGGMGGLPGELEGERAAMMNPARFTGEDRRAQGSDILRSIGAFLELGLQFRGSSQHPSISSSSYLEQQRERQSYYTTKNATITNNVVIQSDNLGKGLEELRVDTRQKLNKIFDESWDERLP